VCLPERAPGAAAVWGHAAADRTIAGAGGLGRTGGRGQSGEERRRPRKGVGRIGRESRSHEDSWKAWNCLSQGGWVHLRRSRCGSPAPRQAAGGILALAVRPRKKKWLGCSEFDEGTVLGATSSFGRGCKSSLLRAQGGRPSSPIDLRTFPAPKEPITWRMEL
jgi:hypothetical protein